MRRWSRPGTAWTLTLFVASVWLVHGLYNKVLFGSPRHLAIVQSVPGLSGARSLRPAGLPRWFGQDFFLAGYRVFARLRLPDGRTLRGLRILRSDANRRSMEAGGNLLTHYRYRLCSADVASASGRIHVTVRTPDGVGDLDVNVDLASRELPASSPFSSMREARRFAGPLPFTFDDEPETNGTIAIRATRGLWQPVPVGVDVRRAAFFDQPEFAGCTPILAAAFHVGEVDYRWERGVWYPVERRPAPVTPS